MKPGNNGYTHGNMHPHHDDSSSGSEAALPRKSATQHTHVFGQNQPTAGERRTLIVVVITAIMMVVEIAAGSIYGSMALLADGLHMGSHAVALGIAAFAYRYDRKHAANPKFSFGTGKVNSLAGFTGAILLVIFAFGMAFESVERLLSSVNIAFDQALAVAVLGLIINGASIFILGIKHHHHDHDHDHDQGHDHGHNHSDHHDHREDHNYKSAYFHVLADALTSLLAIGALLSAKYWGQGWMDPVMGIVGAILVARWSYGLLRDSSNVLLDVQADQETVSTVKSALESLPDTTVIDLHIWTIGPGKKSMIASLEAAHPKSPDFYRTRLHHLSSIVHTSIEVSKSTLK